MTIERSHGKARPTLPRSSDLGTVPPTDADPRRCRTANGQFTSGNQAAVGRGAKAAIRKLLGKGVTLTNAEAISVARDAARLFGDTLRELPNDGPTVRQLVALFARHSALAAYWSAKASAAGLGTAEGIEAQEREAKHGQRVERLSVTMLDVAIKLGGDGNARAAAAQHRKLAEDLGQGGRPR